MGPKKKNPTEMLVKIRRPVEVGVSLKSRIEKRFPENNFI
jgi:hypothetical protein